MVTGWPTVSSSPSVTRVVNPSPLSCTVSMPRWTSTATPSGVRTTKACGYSLNSFPLTGATTSSTSRAGSTAAPGPVMSWANTGSGTCSIGTARPLTGARTGVALMRCSSVLRSDVSYTDDCGRVNIANPAQGDEG